MFRREGNWTGFACGLFVFRTEGNWTCLSYVHCYRSCSHPQLSQPTNILVFLIKPRPHTPLHLEVGWNTSQVHILQFGASGEGLYADNCSTVPHVQVPEQWARSKGGNVCDAFTYSVALPYLS
jgi:hypothetical protein